MFALIKLTNTWIHKPNTSGIINNNKCSRDLDKRSLCARIAEANFLDGADEKGAILGGGEATDKRCEVRMLVLLNKKLHILDIK